MISAVIVTYNEAHKLAGCLQSLNGWADETLIIDLGSHDDILKIAKTFSARVITHPYVSHVELVRNFAISQCRGNWIMVLDPDERLQPKLKIVLSHIAATKSKAVVNIPRQNIFFHTWIKHTNFWPGYQIRFFSKGSVAWKPLLHSYPTSQIPVLQIPAKATLSIRHVSYPSFRSFLLKQVRYAGIRAQERFQAGESASLLVLVYLLAKEFVSKFLKHKGFLDRRYGLMLIAGLLYYFCLVELKLLQLRSRSKQSLKS